MVLYIIQTNFYFQIHMPRLRIVYNIGYGISLTALVLAIIIMIYFK